MPPCPLFCGIAHFEPCSLLNIAVLLTQYCCQLNLAVKKEVILYYLSFFSVPSITFSNVSNDNLEVIVCKSRANKTFKQDHKPSRMRDIDNWFRKGLHTTAVTFPTV